MMKIIRKLAISTLLTCIYLTLNLASADEKVVISSDEQAKEIFLGHYWRCKWKDENYTWNSERMYQKVSLKKVTAKIWNDGCPDGYAKFKGSFKNGTLSGRFSNYPAPCGSGSIVYSGTVFKKADGSYYTKAYYSYGPTVESISSVVAERYVKNTHGETICTATPR